jgi:hypothetical protein
MPHENRTRSVEAQRRPSERACPSGNPSRQKVSGALLLPRTWSRVNFFRRNPQPRYKYSRGNPTYLRPRTLFLPGGPMAICSHQTEIPLPPNWPRRVRSAVVHTISLAQTPLTQARSVAANSINARIRLQEEISRLRQEIHLLREESRIGHPIADPPPATTTRRSSDSRSRAERRVWSRWAARRFLIRRHRGILMRRLDEEGPDAPFRSKVNKFLTSGYLVRRLLSSARPWARPE